MTEIPYGTIGHWKESDDQVDITTFGSTSARYMRLHGREITVMAVDRGRVLVINSNHPGIRPGETIDWTGTPPWEWE